MADFLPGFDDPAEDDDATDPGMSTASTTAGTGNLLPTLFDGPEDDDETTDTVVSGLSGSDALPPVIGDDTPTPTSGDTPSDVLTPITGPDEPVDVPGDDTAAPLAPITGDETPVDPDPVDPGDVLQPITDDEVPTNPDPVDPDTLLSPVSGPGDDAPAPGDANLLQSLLASETDFDAGAGWLGDYGPETQHIWLDHGENVALPDDGLPGTGAGSVTAYEGAPVVDGDGPVTVISGGEGDNVVDLGDDPAYAFGGDGDDTLLAGEGAAALLGGAGADILTGSDANLWADGGTGDDTIQGGAGDDVLYGGAHSASSAAQPDDDVIDGGAGDDVIAGGYGGDTLSGGDGDDVIDNLGRVEETYSTNTANDFFFHTDGAADTLDGGAGNDTLIMDRADNATGGAGFDTFWVFFDGASGVDAADVGDFSVGEDVLRVTLNPDLDHGDMTLSVAPSDDGQDAVVRVNDDVVAMLRGAAGATEADVFVEIGGRFPV